MKIDLALLEKLDHYLAREIELLQTKAEATMRRLEVMLSEMKEFRNALDPQPVTTGHIEITEMRGSQTDVSPVWLNHIMHTQKEKECVLCS